MMESRAARPIVPPASFDAQRAIVCARRTVARHELLIDRASAPAPVRGRARLLCAALGVLAGDAGRALGASSSRPAVTEAAALLSLLTKVDDEVIDGRAFHGGPLRTGGHRALRREVRSYLAPTLESVRTGRAASGEARCELAALVGRELRALAATPDRLDRLHGVIADGWETQVRAVDLLSRHPAESSMAEVAHVTASISGDWLLMITMVGGLPGDAHREFSDAEEGAFAPWGWHIQRADALADFVKDAAEGLTNSWAGRMCFERWGEAYLRALLRRDLQTLDSMLDACAPTCLAEPSALRDGARALETLGDVPTALTWIQAMLVGRWRSRRAQEVG
ncbi:MAG: hypothetical protein KUG77_20975 [Nannocystaceae bacterium]|nr:hypothetical protein [Nannocystaceae bacterium]